MLRQEDGTMGGKMDQATGKVKEAAGVLTGDKGLGRDGSPLCRAYQKSPESRAKIRSGSAIPQRCQNERGLGVVMASASARGTFSRPAWAWLSAWRSGG